MKPNQEENNLLSYLEGEIYYDKKYQSVWLDKKTKTNLRICLCHISEGAMPFMDEVGEFVATAIINERERRKGQEKEKELPLSERCTYWNECDCVGKYCQAGK